MHNEDCTHTILHFSTNIICFVILSGYSIIGNEELVILNSWVQEFLYNLSDTVKAFSILLLTDLCIGFHLPHGWEPMIGPVYKMPPSLSLPLCLLASVNDRYDRQTP